MADKAYGANILPMPWRLIRPIFDPVANKARNIIERAFCHLKDWRAVATRYDKTARNFFAGLCLAVAVTHWLRWVHSLE